MKYSSKCCKNIPLFQKSLESFNSLLHIFIEFISRLCVPFNDYILLFIWNLTFHIYSQIPLWQCLFFMILYYFNYAQILESNKCHVEIYRTLIDDLILTHRCKLNFDPFDNFFKKIVFFPHFTYINAMHVHRVSCLTI